MMSTCHDNSRGVNGKPLVVLDYNQCMQYVDNSDQMAAYYQFVIRTCGWYTFFHIVTQTMMVMLTGYTVGISRKFLTSILNPK